MPPQQRERLLDLVDECLDFGAQGYLRQFDRGRTLHVSEAADNGKTGFCEKRRQYRPRAGDAGASLGASPGCSELPPI